MLHVKRRFLPPLETSQISEVNTHGVFLARPEVSGSMAAVQQAYGRTHPLRLCLRLGTAPENRAISPEYRPSPPFSTIAMASYTPTPLVPAARLEMRPKILHAIAYFAL